MNVIPINLKCSGIYLIRNTINDKIYVGQSRNIARRMWYHRHGEDGCKYLCRAIRLYGWDAFEVSILETVDDISLLDKREQYWIDTLDATNPNIGYNLCRTAGTYKGIKRTAEMRAQMSVARKGKKHTKHAEPIKRTRTRTFKKSVHQIDKITNEIIHTWDSMSSVEKEISIKESGISACCAGKRKTAGGFAWAYAT